MILIDERVGSRELLGLIRGLGVDAELAGKLAADFQFEGNGPDGSVLVGFERKALMDLLDSMRKKRLAGSQIGPMMDTYDICYLVIEGLWRRGRESGMVETLYGKDWRPVRGSFRFSEVSRFLASLRELGGIRTWRTSYEEETAAYIVEEFHWWQKPWNDHKTNNTMYTPEASHKRGGHKPRVFRQDVSLTEAWLTRLPRIDTRAEELATYFVSANDLANATVERWQAIKGIGPKTAREIVEEINKT